jgi:AcrR family transcriptional regulator
MAPKPTLRAAEEPRNRPRAPSRGRGFVRYGALLDATDALLAEIEPDAIGLYQIAERAGVPPASVYHFFPTKAAAFQALAERYLIGFATLPHKPIRADRLRSWQDMMTIEHEWAVEYYNSNPTAMLLFLGGFASPEVNQVDIRFETALASAMFGLYDRVFHMPYMSAPERRFQICWAIADAVWSISYRLGKSITADYAAEALEACLAYCRLFLPAQVELREPYLTAARTGQEVTLPTSVATPDAPPARDRQDRG